MRSFRDPEGADRTKARIGELTNVDLTSFWSEAFSDCPNPDQAISNLESWLCAAANPSTLMQSLTGSPGMARLMLQILGSSQVIADSLIQSPELSGVVLAPEVVSIEPEIENLLAEGRAMIANSTSYTHSLDRIRYLRQRWTLAIVVNDLSSNWPPFKVWRAISDLADTLIQLALEVAWQEFRSGKPLSDDPPISVVAFGKLGGHELNYSSDVDLVFVRSDGYDETSTSRFCEFFCRALTDRMGRGMLYRVDLRLRPYGKSGPISPSWSSVQAYYERYAEPWEVQALLRSRVISSSNGLGTEWNTLVRQTCSGKNISDFMLDSIADQRTRIEDLASSHDLKRGSGGIRDVEFLVQTLVLVHATVLQMKEACSTLQAVHILTQSSFLTDSEQAILTSGYTFLRQLEHRCQLLNDQQTHKLPSSGEDRKLVSLLMGYRSADELETELSLHRKQIREVFQRYMNQRSSPLVPASFLDDSFGREAKAVRTWFQALPESDHFLEALSANAEARVRVQCLATNGPRLLPRLAESVSLTEAVMTGEIEEQPIERLSGLRTDCPLELLAATIKNEHSRLALRWTLSPDFDLGAQLCDLFNKAIGHIVSRTYCSFDVLTMGSFAVGDLSLESDLDLVLLINDQQDQMEAETQAQQFLAICSKLKQLGAPLDIDLRLRPEGNQGLLVRTYEGFRGYELERMEMWERFALGQCRLVVGNDESRLAIHKAAYALPLTPERLKELVQMKKRIESERVQLKHLQRELKLGFGGLSDIEWFVHLHEMRFPTATEVGKYIRFDNRISQLARAGLINAVELEELLMARKHLLETRTRLWLLDLAHDVVPENPDKLERLAHSSGFKAGHDFLRQHESVLNAVRTIYLEGLERLRA